MRISILTFDAFNDLDSEIDRLISALGDALQETT